VADEILTLLDLVKQLREAQRLLLRALAEQAELEMTGVAGDGLVTVSMRDDGKVNSLAFDPVLFAEADAESLGGLTLAALRQAADALRSAAEEKVAAVRAGFITPAAERHPGH
jgi:DNA-binding protein YbaB